MRRRAALAPPILLLAALVAAPAAEAGGLYAVAKLGNTDTSINLATGFGDLIDGDDNSATYGFGLRLGRNLAVQAEYHDLGNVPGLRTACPIDEPICIPQALPVRVDSSALSLSVLPHLLLTRRIRLYGKLGVVSWDSDIFALTGLADQLLEQRSDEELIYGAGLRLELPGPIDGFAEYERIADVFDSVAIGGTWGF